jgi:hypothetical protein
MKLFQNLAPQFPEKEVRDLTWPPQSKENFSCVTAGTVASLVAKLLSVAPCLILKNNR